MSAVVDDRPKQREFCLRLAIRERWDTRKLERQLKSALFERTVLAPPKLSAVLRELQPSAEAVFKDTYLLDKKLLERKLHEFYQLALPAPDRQRQKPKPTRSVSEAAKFKTTRSRVGLALPLSASESPTSGKPRK